MGLLPDAHRHFAPDLGGCESPGFLCTTSPKEFFYLSSSQRIGKDEFLFLGLHPWYATEEEVMALEGMMRRDPKRMFGLGEVGLDKRKGVDFSVQVRVFEKVVGLADEFNLVLNVHCVRSYKDLVSMTSELKVPVIVHGFSGSEYYARLLSERGYYISFSPGILKRQDKFRPVVSAIGVGRILIETDYPYQTKDCEVLLRLSEVLSEWLGVEREVFEERVRANFWKIVEFRKQNE